MTQRMDTQPSSERFEVLYEELYTQCDAGKGLTDELCSKLEKLSEQKITELVSQQRNGVTPLFLSAKRGNVDMVNYLLEKCKADVNQLCKSFCIIGYVTEMTPVMETTNLDIARCLLEHGADYLSQALLVQIGRSNLEMANYLVTQGADINDAPTSRGNMCLHVVNNNPQVYETFIKYGANVNARNALRQTPLHLAVNQRQLWKVELLLRHGANPRLKDYERNDILRLTCRRGHLDIFKLLMERVDYSPGTRANGYELMGALCASKQNPNLMLELWKTALKIRQISKHKFLKRNLREEPPPIANVPEFRTQEDLDKLVSNNSAMLAQAMLIIHRILGPHDVSTLEIQMPVLDAFHKNNDFRKCLHLLDYNLRGFVKSDGLVGKITRATVSTTAHMFLEVVDIIGVDHQQIDFHETLYILSVISAQFGEPMMDINVYYFFTLVLDRLIKMPKIDNQLELLKALIREVVQKKFCDHKGRSLLHIVASIRKPEGVTTAMGKLYSLNLDRAPVVRFLLECGHEVDVLDRSGSSPLHLAAGNVSDADVVNCLLAHGAHIDRINANGIRPCQLLDDIPGVNSFNYTTLKCLATRIVVDCELSYKHLEFPALDAFIAMH